MRTHRAKFEVQTTARILQYEDLLNRYHTTPSVASGSTGSWKRGSRPSAYTLLEKTVETIEGVLQKSEAGGREPDGMTIMSKGACIPLRRILEKLRSLQ